MRVYRCQLCSYEYDEAKEGVAFADLPDDWVCPVGIATQDPALRARLDIDKSATRVANFLRVSTEELRDFARLTGHDDVHGMCIDDLCTTNSEISGYTPIKHV